MASRTEKAAALMLKAAEHRKLDGSDIPGYENGTMKYHRQRAERLEAIAEKLLSSPLRREITAGEILPTPADNCIAGTCGGNIRETLEQPDRIAGDASVRRTGALFDAGVLEMGLDAANSIGAKNSFEKMLAHQMALAHEMTMKTGRRAIDEGDAVEHARLVNASARMMKTFQDGLLTLHKIRHGGQQTINVNRLELRENSQAVLAANMGGPNAG